MSNTIHASGHYALGRVMKHLSWSTEYQDGLPESRHYTFACRFYFSAGHLQKRWNWLGCSVDISTNVLMTRAEAPLLKGCCSMDNGRLVLGGPSVEVLFTPQRSDQSRVITSISVAVDTIMRMGS